MPDLHILCDSNPAAGALFPAADGSRFTVNLDEPIQMYGAKNIRLSVESAKIWYTFLNVFQGVNDKIYITADGTEVVLTLDPGFYELDSLGTTLKNLWKDSGDTPVGVPDLPISITPNWSTQRVYLSNLTDDAVSVDFSKPDTFRELLGFDSAVVNLAAGVGRDGDSTAMFNVISNLYVCSDICPGIRINHNFQNVLCEVPLGTPHSQIVYEPQRPIEIQVPQLAFTPLKQFSMWITNQKGEPVNTTGDFWSARIKLSWETKDS